MRHRASVLLILAAACSAVVAAQQPTAPAGTGETPPVTFRVEVDYVEVDASVTDEGGRPVANLTADDFEVFEDGKRQEVTSFSSVNIPVERAERPRFAASPIVPDVQTNVGVDGRVYLFVLDDINTAFNRAPRVKLAARQFIERNFGANDLAAVVFTGGRAEDAQDFTNNPRLLLASIDRFMGRKIQSATAERLQNIRENPSTGELEAPDDPNRMERAYRARAVLSSVKKLAEFMAGVRGRRKAMLLFGEGIDYNIFDAVGASGTNSNVIMQETQDAIAAATRANVSIYALDPRGLQVGTEDLIGEQSAPASMPTLGLTSALDELRLSQQSLQVMAENTGGFAAINQNDSARAFERIVAENSSYYMLGYYAGNSRRDGRYRKIEVRVKRPGLRVRARNGYYEARGRRPNTPAPSAGVPRVLVDALGSPLPGGDLRMRLHAAAFKGAAPNAAVAISVEVDGSGLQFVEKDGAFLEQIGVMYSATDVKGKLFPGQRHLMDFKMTADTSRQAAATGIRLVTQMDLPPGRYQIRMAASNMAGRAGTVLYDLEVPDFTKPALAMSGVALTSAKSASAPTAKPKNPLADFLPAPQAAIREFDRGDLLAVFAEFYENVKGASPHQLAFTAELRADGGTVVAKATDERSSTELSGAKGGYGFAPRISLADVPAGLYVLHIEGQSLTADRPTVSRDILLRVR